MSNTQQPKEPSKRLKSRLIVRVEDSKFVREEFMNGDNSFYGMTLTKIRSVHENLRTDTMEGRVQALPRVGETFYIFGVGIEFGTRLIYTTEVKEIRSINKNTIEFKTKNSTYRLSQVTDVATD